MTEYSEDFDNDRLYTINLEDHKFNDQIGDQIIREYIKYNRSSILFYMIFFIFMFIASVVTIVIGSIVVSDYHETTEYTEQLCSGKDLTDLKIMSGPTCSHGTIESCVVSITDKNYSCLYNVTLFYPPIKHWFLGAKTRHTVKKWADDLFSKETFTCYIKHPDKNGSIGISDYYNKILAYSILIGGGIVILSIILWTTYSRRKCLKIYICDQRESDSDNV